MTRILIGLALLLLTASTSAWAKPKKLECIAPSSAGGGLEIICQLLADTLPMAHLVEGSVDVRLMPGGIGARGMNYAINSRRGDAQLLIAASTGSVLNLALGKYGRHAVTDVRWLGAVAADHALVAVRADVRWPSFAALIDELRRSPETVVFGGGGSVGSQDWMKFALLFQQLGVDLARMRYVALEGGGAATTYLANGLIDVFSGDLSEVQGLMQSGKLRALAVFSAQRLEPPWQEIPTARELGHDVVWPVWRGVYLPPGVSDREYLWWTQTLTRLASSPYFQQRRRELGLSPLLMVGPTFEEWVEEQYRDFVGLAGKMGIAP